MAPGVDIESYGFEQEGGLQQGFLYTDPGDLEADYTEAITRLRRRHREQLDRHEHGAQRLSRASGRATTASPTSLIDTIVARQHSASPFRVVWANGNERGLGTCGTTYHTTAPPACAKNHITVGALNSERRLGDELHLLGTVRRRPPEARHLGTRLPDRRRRRRDLVRAAPAATTSSAARRWPARRWPASLRSCCRSTAQSFPGAAGLPQLDAEAPCWRTRRVDLVNAGPDYQTGYGSVRVEPAVDLIAGGTFHRSTTSPRARPTRSSCSSSRATPRSRSRWRGTIPGTPNVEPRAGQRPRPARDRSARQPCTTRGRSTRPTRPRPRCARSGTTLNNIEQVVIDNPAPRRRTAWRSTASTSRRGRGSRSAPLPARRLIQLLLGGRLSRPPTVACGALRLAVMRSSTATSNIDDGVSRRSRDRRLRLRARGRDGDADRDCSRFRRVRGDASVSARPTRSGVLRVIARATPITVTYIDADDGAGGQRARHATAHRRLHRARR